MTDTTKVSIIWNDLNMIVTFFNIETVKIQYSPFNLICSIDHMPAGSLLKTLNVLLVKHICIFYFELKVFL